MNDISNALLLTLLLHDIVALLRLPSMFRYCNAARGVTFDTYHLKAKWGRPTPRSGAPYAFR